ncbi:MAG: aquaporin family protein [Saprospiraceae bacterium]|nr:aquaporin family protein [Saprospiraceae bacterium]
MNPLISEIIGTSILILLGNGVVANVVLKDTKGNSGGWIVITFGWAIGVFVAVYVAGPFSGAHINPIITLALAVIGKFPWGEVIPYILAQVTGAMIGSLMVWISYKKHYDITENPGLIEATFCTAPAISDRKYNFITESIGTFILVIGVLYIVSPSNSLGSLDALPVSLLVLGIGLSLGGPTGYAINPARDLGPRIMHSILPIPHKGKTDWKYALIPIAGPITGSLLASGFFMLLSS